MRSSASASLVPANSFAPLPPSPLSLTFSSSSPVQKRPKRKLPSDANDGGAAGDDDDGDDRVTRDAREPKPSVLAPSRDKSPPPPLIVPRKVSALDAYPVVYGDASPTAGDTKDDDVKSDAQPRLETHLGATATNGGGGDDTHVESEKKESEQTTHDASDDERSTVRVSHEIAPFRKVGPNAVSLVFDGVELPFVIALQRSMMEGATSWRGRSTVTAYAGVVNSQAIRENLDLLPVFVPAHYEAEMRRRARAAIAAYEAQLDGDGAVAAAEDDGIGDDDDDEGDSVAADRDGDEAAPRKRRKTAATARRRRSNRSLEPCRTCRVFADPLSTVTHPRGYATTPRATPSTGLDAVAAAPPVGWSGNGLTAVEVEPEPLCDNCSVTFKLHARHDRNRAPWSDVTSSSFVWQPPAWYAAYRRKMLRRRGGGGDDASTAPDDAAAIGTEPHVIRKALITHLAGSHHISATLVACRGSKFSHKRARFMATTTCAATALYRIRVEAGSAAAASTVVAATTENGDGERENDGEEKSSLAPGASNASSSPPVKRGDADAGGDPTSTTTTSERDPNGDGGSDEKRHRAAALTNDEKVRVARECCRRVFRLLPTTTEAVASASVPATLSLASLRGADTEGDEKKSETEIARVNANPTEWLGSDPRNGVRLEVYRPDHSDGCDECQQLVASFGKPDALAVERDPHRHRLRFATAGEPPARVLLEGTEFLRRRVAHLRSAFAAYRADLVRLERKRRGSQ